jgi:hypothetical protein
MLHTNNRLHGDGKVNSGVTTKLSKIKSCNRIVKAYGKNKQPTNHTRIILGIKYKTGYHQGRIQDFKLGGAHFKKLRRAEGGAKIFGVFRVKNHDFTPKKSYFCCLLEGSYLVYVVYVCLCIVVSNTLFYVVFFFSLCTLCC